MSLVYIPCILTFLCPKLLKIRSQFRSVQASSVVIPWWTVILCFLKVDFQANFSSHKSHLMARVSSCIAICWCTDSILVNVCWHTLHSNFEPSPVILTSPYFVWIYLPPFLLPKVRDDVVVRDLICSFDDGEPLFKLFSSLLIDSFKVSFSLFGLLSLIFVSFSFVDAVWIAAPWLISFSCLRIFKWCYSMQNTWALF